MFLFHRWSSSQRYPKFEQSTSSESLTGPQCSDDSEGFGLVTLVSRWVRRWEPGLDAPGPRSSFPLTVESGRPVRPVSSVREGQNGSARRPRSAPLSFPSLQLMDSSDSLGCIAPVCSWAQRCRDQVTRSQGLVPRLSPSPRHRAARSRMPTGLLCRLPTGGSRLVSS